MMSNNSHQEDQVRKPSIFSWDRRLLLGFIALSAIVFLILNRQANGFMSDARLYPYVVTLLGLALCVLSVIRVLMGKEPNHDAQNGKEHEIDDSKVKNNYKMTLGYLCAFAGFYGAIVLFGFIIPAAVFVFGFMRFFGQSYKLAAIYTVCGLLMVEGLSRLLNLELPTGLLIEMVKSA